jgi:hypothetical protein
MSGICGISLEGIFRPSVDASHVAGALGQR